MGKNALDFSKEQIIETEKDMSALHITDADVKAKASEYIDEIVKFINVLIKKEYAYKTKAGNVYFRVNKFKEYGKLSHRKAEDLLDGVRVENDEEKENPVDFALWKSAKAGEIFWKTELGEGRPGWHIECSVMALKNLGETIDIHGGGRDLIFPHHENEIAQSESYTGKMFAKYWSHCGLIKINGEKMSKSLGNSLTIREVLEKYNYEVIKYMMFSKHYSSDIDVTENEFKQAENHVYYFYKTIQKMNLLIRKNPLAVYDFKKEQRVKNNLLIREKFVEAMDDDFGTQNAIGSLHGIFKYVNQLMETNRREEDIASELNYILNEIKRTYKVLGFFEQEPERFIKQTRDKYLKKINLTTDEIEEKIFRRSEAKKNKNYEEADEIRDSLRKVGIILNDNKDGTSWDLEKLY